LQAWRFQAWRFQAWRFQTDERKRLGVVLLDRAEAPARVLHHGIGLQPLDDGVELVWNGAGPNQCRRELDLIVLLVDGLDLLHRVVRRFQLVAQQLAALVAVAGADPDVNLIDRFRTGVLERRAVDRVDQRAKQRVAGEHEERQQNRLERQVGAGTGADRRRAPQRCRGVEAPDVAALLHDDAGAEETDAGNHIRDDLRGAGVTVQMHADVDEGGGAHGHQHMRAQAAAALAVLPFGADQRAEDKGGEQADQRVEEIRDREGMKEGHSNLRKIRCGSLRPREGRDPVGALCGDALQPVFALSCARAAMNGSSFSC
jgi:hypothetical protein